MLFLGLLKGQVGNDLGVRSLESLLLKHTARLPSGALSGVEMRSRGNRELEG
jgi:hypothetical protein